MIEYNAMHLLDGGLFHQFNSLLPTNLQVGSNMNALFDGLTDADDQKNRAELELRGRRNAAVPNIQAPCPFHSKSRGALSSQADARGDQVQRESLLAITG